ncbi:hypothetical protein [Actinocorallia herbida]|uniref:hypothetical protein n=1 Tax=Actinocorallia herbida TaxID=58109 RepID=UPI000F4C5D6B|nr:hypothetical protein [Actinocorallia herbida]
MFEFLFRILLSALGMAVSAWTLMLAVGAVHAWWPMVPTMSFETAIPIAFIVSTGLGIVYGISAVTKELR